MRRLISTIVFLIFFAGAMFAGRAAAQTSAPERAAALGAQLIEVQARQSELQTRLQQVEENLKPEAIEHSLAGIGSTHPEELRAQRRRQLEIERDGVRAQLDLLSISRTRLERLAVEASGQAYQQSAGSALDGVQPHAGTASAGPQSSKASNASRASKRKKTGTRKHHRRL